MKREKYMGLDVHQATTVAAVMNAEGQNRAGNDGADQSGSDP